MGKMNIDSCNFPHETPVLLFFKGDRRIKKNYFLIKDIDECSGCITLEELRECPLCCEEFVLVPTNQCILIDSHCICAFQLLHNACIRNCKHCYEFEDLICGSFALLPDYDESIIWQSNLEGSQFGDLFIKMEDCTKESCEVRIYSKDSKEFISYPIGDTFVVNLAECSAISIFCRTNTKKVSGEFEIHLKNEIEVNRLSYD